MKQTILCLLTFIVIFLAGCKKETSPVEPQPNPNLPEKLILNLTDTSATGNYILRWTSSAKATSYTLQEDIDPPFNNASTVYLGTDTTYRISGKPFGKTFYYRVRGNNSIGSGQWSEKESVVVYHKPAPNILVTTNHLDFGEVFVDSAKVFPLSIGNSGDDTLQIINVHLGGGAFSVNNALPLKIAPSGVGYLSLKFHPLANGVQLDSLTVESNDLDDYPPQIVLTGKGVTTSRMIVNVSTLVFGNVFVDSAKILSLTVSNTGNEPLLVSNVTSDTSVFSIIGAANFSIAPGGHQELIIRFHPINRTSYTGTLSIFSNDSSNNPRVLALSGRGVAPVVSVTPDSLSFWVYALIGTKDRNLTITNDGDVTLQIYDIVSTSSRVSITGSTSYSISPRNRAVTTLRYTSATVGNDTGIVTLVTNDPKHIGFNLPFTASVYREPIFVGTNVSGVFRSTNHGTSWIQLTLIGDVGVRGISPGGFIYAGGYRSTDAGDSWIALSRPSNGFSCFAVDSSGGWVGGGNAGVFRSTDNGNSWTQIGLPDNAGVKALIVDSNGWIFAGTFRSTDYGVHWNKMSLGDSLDIHCFTIDEKGYLYAGGYNAAEGGVYTSSDGGANWAPTTLGGKYIMSLASKPNGYVFAGTDNGYGRIFLSKDGGSSWTEVATTNSSVYSLGVDSQGTIFAGTGSGVFRSTNDGNDWIQVNNGLTSTRVNSLIIGK